MTYCPKCGARNEDDARFCKSCGQPVAGPPGPPGQPQPHQRGYDKEWEDRCDQECSGRRASSTWITFWIVILALVAVGIVISILVRVFAPALPDWLVQFNYWDICGLVVVLVIVIMIITALARTRERRGP